MIYTIKNNKIVPLVSKSGKRFSYKTKHDKRLNTKRSKHSHKYYTFYNSAAWRRTSRNVRKAEPICRECKREYKAGKRKLENVNISSSVDHIVPLKVDWSKRLDPNNLQPLCKYHHELKSSKNL